MCAIKQRGASLATAVSAILRTPLYRLGEAQSMASSDQPLTPLGVVVARSGLQLAEPCNQCMAAYMIFSCVASVAEYSTTTLPCLATRMRSDSDITSGK